MPRREYDAPAIVVGLVCVLMMAVVVVGVVLLVGWLL